MIEAYAFLAMFVAQILTGSVVFPERVISRVRRWAQESGSERFRQMYPEVDYDRSVGRFVVVFRAANIAVAVSGLLLLGWFYVLAGQSNWTAEMKMPVVGYVFAQFAPLVFLAVYGVVRCFKLLVQPSQEVKRTATLQRRGLFDFVSPFAFWLAIGSYLGFVVFAIYLDLEVYQHASISRRCYGAIIALTLVYVLNAFVIYKYLYGRKNPLLSREGRAHAIGVNVKGAVHVSTAAACFFSLLGVVGQPHLKQWEPFALSLFIVVTWLLCLMSMSAPHKAVGGATDSRQAS